MAHWRAPQSVERRHTGGLQQLRPRRCVNAEALIFAAVAGLVLAVAAILVLR